MKKIIFLLFIVLLCGCEDENKSNLKTNETSTVKTTKFMTSETNDIAPIETETTTTDVEITIENITKSQKKNTKVKRNRSINDIEDKKIVAILKNEKPYYNTEFKKYDYLKNYSSNNYMCPGKNKKYKYICEPDNIDMTIDQWCEVDLNGDGNKEVVLLTEPYGTVLVLHHAENDIIYCYAFPFRGMKCIKTDGSFECSGSAADTEIFKLKFQNGDCYDDEIYVFDGIDKRYRVNKKNVSQKEVRRYLAKQEQKEDVKWYDW